jgi:hypothetical protein
MNKGDMAQKYTLLFTSRAYLLHGHGGKRVVEDEKIGTMQQRGLESGGGTLVGGLGFGHYRRILGRWFRVLLSWSW